MNSRDSFIKIYAELFMRGEILKAQNLINNCVPLELQDDPGLQVLRDECNNRINEIAKWNTDGRPYPGTHATVEFTSFPKFVKAKKKIQKAFPDGADLLDIGCYSGVFMRGFHPMRYSVFGTDIHKELMEKMRESHEKYNWDFASCEKLPYCDMAFDVVTAFDILEHVINLDKALVEIDRVTKPGGLVIINLPRMTPGYQDEAFEHLRMFSDKDIKEIWGNKKNFKLELCQDELGRPTSFITYIK